MYKRNAKNNILVKVYQATYARKGLQSLNVDDSNTAAMKLLVLYFMMECCIPFYFKSLDGRTSISSDPLFARKRQDAGKSGTASSLHTNGFRSALKSRE